MKKCFTYRTKLPNLPKPIISKSKLKSWPDSVPVLTRKDICVGSLNGKKEGTHCLLGWAYECKMPSDFHFRLRRYAAILSSKEGRSFGFISINDEYGTKAFCAKLWNKTIADFGYTEGNPEAESCDRRI